ncbi:MAG TPA: TlpA disulfide reductase family protein [Planctomycetota bacterium]|nr:TlpA disulfide reductase family protein [Planctomycetota bacterium]
MRFAALLAAALLGSCAGGNTDYGRRPDWAITLPSGQKVSAADYDQKVVIVDFWATWCPPCRQEVPGFIALQKKYADKGLVIVGFSFDQDPTQHEVWIKQQGMNYLSIFAETEAGHAIAEQFGKQVGEIQGLPTTLVIDRKGKIVFRHIGYAPPEEFEKVIAPLF